MILGPISGQLFLNFCYNNSERGLLMPLPTNFRNIINKDVVEQIRVECKKGWNPMEAVQSVCSFANDIDNFGGGYIIIGAEYDAEDDRYVFYDFGKKQLDDIQKELTEYCLKAIKPRFPMSSNTKASISSSSGRMRAMTAPTNASTVQTTPSTARKFTTSARDRRPLKRLGLWNASF